MGSMPSIRTSLSLKIPLRAYEFLIPHCYVQDWIMSIYHFLENLPEEITNVEKYRIYQLRHFPTSSPRKSIDKDPTMCQFLTSSVRFLRLQLILPSIIPKTVAMLNGTRTSYNLSP